MFPRVLRFLPLRIVFIALLISFARADVSLLLEEAIGVAGALEGTGHAAIYFSNICADSPLRVRLCRPGEKGAVISRYDGFSAAAQYGWFAIPVLPFLYGVEDDADIPLYANAKVRDLLRDRYRRDRLIDLLPDLPGGKAPPGHWRAVVGALLDRDIYSFTLHTTPEQDAQRVAELNRDINKNHFHETYSNCADFARIEINRYFPHAVHRDPINDFGVTTPKALAKSLTSFASRHPELDFAIAKLSQVSGPIKRSEDNKKITEAGFRLKKYSIPLLWQPEVLALFGGAYAATGRFNPDLEYRKRAGAADRVDGEAAWDQYRVAFRAIVAKAIHDGIYTGSKELTTFFHDLEAESEPALDEHGGVYLNVKTGSEYTKLGLTRGNILGDNSDRRLAFKLMLAKTDAELSARPKNRCSLSDFRRDWNLLIRFEPNSR